jgi:hypothetical protein
MGGGDASPYNPKGIDRSSEKSSWLRYLFSFDPFPSAHPFNILSDMGSRLFHQEVKEIPHDHTEKFLDRTGNKCRAELEKKEVNKTIERSGVTFFHFSPRSGF